MTDAAGVLAAEFAVEPEWPALGAGGKGGTPAFGMASKPGWPMAVLADAGGGTEGLVGWGIFAACGFGTDASWRTWADAAALSASAWDCGPITSVRSGIPWSDGGLAMLFRNVMDQ